MILYHHTTPTAAQTIAQQRRFESDLRGRGGHPCAYFTTELGGHADGRGSGVVTVEVPDEVDLDQWLDDEFPSGERHYEIPVHMIRPEWITDGTKVRHPLTDRRNVMSTPTPTPADSGATGTPDEPFVLTVTTEDEAYRVTSRRREYENGATRYDYIVDRCVQEEDGDESAVWEHAWSSGDFDGGTYDTAEEAAEMGRAAVLSQLGDPVTLEMVLGLCESVRVLTVVGTGVDSSDWRFGQFAGLSWMFAEVVTHEGGGIELRRTLGTWSTLDVAHTAISGMRDLLLYINGEREVAACRRERGRQDRAE